MSEIRFDDIFGPELYDRLVWFGRLRWFAVSGLAVAAAAGPRLGFPSVWPSLFAVATVVAIYNSSFQTLLRRRREALAHAFGRLRAISICLTLMDLAALTVTVHFTGGLQSPLLLFFAFHMAIGTIMIATRIMYLLAGVTCLGAVALYLLEAGGLLGFHPLDSLVHLESRAAGLNLLTLMAALFGVVYVTDSVTSRVKQRNLELYGATEALSNRTEELQRLLDEFELLERRKSHYMRISAHQLRSPVGTIKASLQVLLDGYVDPSSERGRKLLSGAAERADGLLAIINDLLDLAKIREGRGTKAPWSSGVNVNQLLADLFDSMEPAARKRGVRLIPDFEGVAILDWGLPPDLVHAFENLIYNAIKYSEPGGVVTVRMIVEGNLATIRVIDHGVGIPEEYLDQVFMEFVRAPNAKHHAGEGTGLGLAIVKEVISAHGGRVAVQSREGEGSTFTVTLSLHYEPVEVRRLLLGGNDPGYRPDTPSGPGGPVGSI